MMNMVLFRMMMMLKRMMVMISSQLEEENVKDFLSQILKYLADLNLFKPKQNIKLYLIYLLKLEEEAWQVKDFLSQPSLVSTTSTRYTCDGDYDDVEMMIMIMMIVLG